MRFVSLFAGIGGFDLALERLGYECVWANEWDEYAAKTYTKNFGMDRHREKDFCLPKRQEEINSPGTCLSQDERSNNSTITNACAKNHIDTRDITTVPAEDIPPHDLLVGGFPCQSFSVAGKRGGFQDTRGTLFYEIARIAKHHRPSLLLLENVKGLLSHDNGKTFEVILRTFDELGYELQWQVCNSKNFGVPQNRERVFIVGHTRGTPRPKVFPFRGDAKKDPGQIVSTALDANYWKGIDNHGQRTAIVQRVPLKFLNRNQKNIEGDYAYTVDSLNTGGVMVGTLRTHKDGNGFRQMQSGLAPTIPARAREDGSGQGVVVAESRIRRLTPLECERLQGFPDGWTEGVSDTQRYKQLGNAVTVNVVQAIAERL